MALVDVTGVGSAIEDLLRLGGGMADDLQCRSFHHLILPSAVNPGGACGMEATIRDASGGATVGFGVRVMVDLSGSMQVRVVFEDCDEGGSLNEKRTAECW